MAGLQTFLMCAFTVVGGTVKTNVSTKEKVSQSPEVQKRLDHMTKVTESPPDPRRRENSQGSL